ncbi:hypothetical protein HK103_001916 [Boothiomyces macroporosus]|uniref:Protein kinase domain-containing protein n=1 Tax=Boothiomyces macroporosus TaxID=261099 RepID=A0AAD5UK33_9FUNG|nr:hypothetical protein HK103_001916 [Boothiomyces macroporosus]
MKQKDLSCPNILLRISKDNLADLSTHFDITTKKSTVTTTTKLNILTANFEFLEAKEDDIIGKSLTRFIDPPDDIMQESIVTVRKSNGETFKAVAKIQEKFVDNNCVYVWDIEEIVEQQCTLIIENPLSVIIPKLDATDIFEEITLFKYFCGKDKNLFPLSAKIEKVHEQYSVTLTSMPTIAGLVTVSQQGFIDCVNDQLSKALIGRSKDDLIGIDITDIIPTFWGFIKDMEWELREMNQKEPFIHSPRCQLADYDPSSCAHSPSSSRNSCVQCTSKPRLVNLRHRDGSLLPVSIQGRIWKPSNAEDPLYAIWLNFSKEEAPLIETLAVETTTDYKTNKEQFPLASPDLIPNISKKQVKPIFTKHKIEDFEVIKALGEGAHSYVKLCSLKSDPTFPLVMKYIVRTRILTFHRSETLGRVPTEIAVLHDLKEKSPLLPNMLHFFYDDFFYFLITEYTDSTDLFEYIESSNLAENSIKRIYKQVLEAIGIIHSMDIVHRDLKDENILIDKNENIQLIDFGSSAYCSSGPFTTFYGTSLYSPPETLLGHPYEGKPQDMWQLGILLYAMIYKDTPFYTHQEILKNELVLPYELSNECTSLLRSLLNSDITARITIDQALTHPWMK